MVKKLLMTADTVGGVWTYALELSRSLRPHGVEVALATMGRRPSVSQLREVRSVENIQLFESEFRLEWMENAWQDLSDAGAWLLNIRDRFQPDLVHLNGYVHGTLPWDVPIAAVGHSCVFSWWQAVHGTLPPPTWNKYRDEVTKGLRAANHVATPSRAMLRSLQEFYGPLASTNVVPNGRDPGAFHAGRKFPIILSAGRLWDPAKNVSILIEIADHLTWPVYLAGETEFEHDGLNAQGVQYLGCLASEDLSAWMAKAAIFVAPARYEPFGYTVLEAALSGCALVLADIPSLRENWSDSAVFVSACDRLQMRETLEHLIGNAQYRLELAGRARHRAGEFSPEKMAAGYMDIYETLCGSFSSITR
jgi:glycogen synthase